MAAWLQGYDNLEACPGRNGDSASELVRSYESMTLHDVTKPGKGAARGQARGGRVFVNSRFLGRAAD